MRRFALLLGLALAACSNGDAPTFQGYVEGDS
jgi:hypothetical protein